MSDIVIFDTSVLVDELRTGRHRKRIDSTEGLVRTSSVVLAELLRGVVGEAERKFLRSLARNHPILSPTQKNWLESGQILASMRADQVSSRTNCATCISTLSSLSQPAPMEPASSRPTGPTLN